MFSQLTSVVANFSPCHPTEIIQPSKFMPSQWNTVTKVKRRRVNSKKLADDFRRAFAGQCNIIEQKVGGMSGITPIPNK